MSVFTSIRNSADKLIRKYSDKVVTRTVRTSGTFNPITGKYDGATATDTPIEAVVLPVDKGTALNAKFMEGRVIGETRKLICPQEVVLRPGDELKFQASRWNVLDASSIDPDGSGNIVTIAYVERNGAIQ